VQAGGQQVAVRTVIAHMFSYDTLSSAPRADPPRVVDLVEPNQLSIRSAVDSRSALTPMVLR
jgi:hypothetical protein